MNLLNPMEERNSSGCWILSKKIKARSAAFWCIRLTVSVVPEGRLEACSGTMNILNLPVYLENAISLSRKLNTVWTSGDIHLKEDL